MMVVVIAGVVGIDGVVTVVALCVVVYVVAFGLKFIEDLFGVLTPKLRNPHLFLLLVLQLSVSKNALALYVRVFNTLYLANKL